MGESRQEMRHRLAGEPLSLLLPSDWQVWEPPANILFLASAPDEAEPFEAQLTVSKEMLPVPTDSIGYLVGNLVSLRSMLISFQDLGAGEFAVEGATVAWLAYSANVEGFDVTAIDFFLSLETQAYVIHCVTPQSVFSQWEEFFRRVGASIDVIRGGLDQ